jgi:hypothetical protein
LCTQIGVFFAIEKQKELENQLFIVNDKVVLCLESAAVL